VLRAILAVTVADDYLMGIVIAHANRDALTYNSKALGHLRSPNSAPLGVLP
jgi:hypothetical protein